MKNGSISLLRREYNSELIEIVIPAGTTKTKFQFPDQQNLRDTHILGLTTFTNDIVPVSIVSDNPVALLPFLKKVFVTLQAYNGENFAWQKPAVKLIDQEASTTFDNYAPEAFTKQRVNWPKSYIEIAAGAIIPVVDTVVIFEVNYLKASAAERKQRESKFRKRS